MSNLIKFLKKIFNLNPPLFVAFDSGVKNKKTIVLLHGIAATSKTWDLFIKQLDTKDYRIIAIDLLGFGNSPKPINCEYSIDDHVASIRKTIRRLKIRKPYQIIGHSMGAIIAAHYSNKFQDEIKKLYLLSLPFYPRENGFKISNLRTNLFLDAYDFLSNNKQFTITNSQILRKLLQINDGVDVNESNWEAFRLSLKNVIINQDVYNDLIGIKIPVKIIYGGFDLLSFSDTIDRLKELKNVEVFKLKEIDHLIGSSFAKQLADIVTPKND